MGCGSSTPTAAPEPPAAIPPPLAAPPLAAPPSAVRELRLEMARLKLDVQHYRQSTELQTRLLNQKATERHRVEALSRKHAELQRDVQNVRDHAANAARVCADDRHGRLAAKAFETLRRRERAITHELELGLQESEEALRRLRDATKAARQAAEAARRAAVPGLSGDAWETVALHLSEDGSLSGLLAASRGCRDAAAQVLAVGARGDFDRGVMNGSIRGGSPHSRTYLDAWMCHAASELEGPTVALDAATWLGAHSDEVGVMSTLLVLSTQKRYLLDRSPHRSMWHPFYAVLDHRTDTSSHTISRKIVESLVGEW